jgi:hypothetical protein
MKFHLEHKLQVITETSYKNLYQWAINERNDSKNYMGRDQIPWRWSLYFTAIDITFGDEITIREEIKADSKAESQQAEVLHRRRISARLVPGDSRQADESDCPTSYRMFGTDRKINDFKIDIYPLDSEDDTEICSAWGSVSYSSDLDFQEVTMGDCIIFYLMVKPSAFNNYISRISDGTVDEVILSVGDVAGFYSEWSASISAREIKVLTRGEEHALQVPEDSDAVIPRLGSVGTASLYINSKRVLMKNSNRIE